MGLQCVYYQRHSSSLRDRSVGGFCVLLFRRKDGQKESHTVESLIRSLIAQFSAASGGVATVDEIMPLLP
jgi:hypothetical protein